MELRIKSNLLHVSQFHAVTKMPISHLVAGASSTSRKTKLRRDRWDTFWIAIDKGIRSTIAAEL